MTENANGGKLHFNNHSFLVIYLVETDIHHSKHMDKHERPYKCEAQGCEKLQGFTYSGGLLRHQREVHKMHGGTKEPLYCHYMNCKRSSGAGFTRKENRDEHIRRVHRRATDGADGSTAAKRDREDMEAADALLRGDVSQVEVHELDTENVDPIANTPAPKRRRITQPATHHSNGNSNSNGISNGVIDPAIDSDLDLKAMVKHLQETNNLLVKQNDTIRRDHQLLSDRLNRLEESLGRNGVPVPEPMLGYARSSLQLETEAH